MKQDPKQSRKDRFIGKLSVIEAYFDRFKFWLSQKIGSNDPIMIMPYRGYGTSKYLFLKGRVLEDKQIETSKEDSRIRNLRNNYKRFGSDEVPNAKLRITYHKNIFEVTTDDEGYFTLDTQLRYPIGGSLLTSLFRKTPTWQLAQIELLEAPVPTKESVYAQVDVLTPSRKAEFGVISDIDDTMMQTDVKATLKMKTLYNTLFKNAHSRVALEHVPEFYTALHKGSNGKKENPLFYVSNSPWNLYDLLLEFMNINKIPKAPIFLRDFGLNKDGLASYRDHKYNMILHILKTYPKLPFILIGDSGEKDARIYQKVAEKHKNRIKAIYIRSVGHQKQAEYVAGIAKQTPNMLLVDNYLTAAKDAFKRKMITQRAFNEMFTKNV